MVTRNARLIVLCPGPREAESIAQAIHRLDSTVSVFSATSATRVLEGAQSCAVLLYMDPKFAHEIPWFRQAVPGIFIVMPASTELADPNLADRSTPPQIDHAELASTLVDILQTIAREGPGWSRARE